MPYQDIPETPSEDIVELKYKILTKLEEVEFKAPNSGLSNLIQALATSARSNRKSLEQEWNNCQQHLNRLQPPPENYEEIQYNISCIMFIDELNDLLKNADLQDQATQDQITQVQQAFLNLHTAKIKLMEEQVSAGNAHLLYYGFQPDNNNRLVPTNPPRSPEQTATYNQQIERYKRQIKEYDHVKDSFNNAIDALPPSWGSTLKRYGHQLLHYLKLMLANPVVGAIIGAAIAPVMPSIVATAAVAFVGAMVGQKISHFIHSKLFQPGIPPDISKEQKNIDSAKKKLGSAKRYQEKVKKSKEDREKQAAEKEYLNPRPSVGSTRKRQL
ncbi:MAG: hypothetical protein K0R24_1454 [Gammaproteobacteria bacterium]|jgi:hypothetical protein|nr:hypothetical protein [Gammaproteobacteria bacterium]